MTRPTHNLILDLCGGTGSWSRPYAEAGYEVINVTLPEQDVVLYEPPDNVHGILAAPPCTEFSFAKHFHGKGKYTHDFKAGLQIVDACLRIIWRCQPKWWALENPKGYLRRWFGEPQSIFNPWQYGDGYQKATCLWGAFVMPKPTVCRKPKGIEKFSMLRSKDIHPEYHSKLSRQERRAITPPGFAKAFFEANP